jgi:3-phosphoglycerate kinase
MNKQFKKMTIRDIPVDGKTVLLRADYNVPLESDGSIADDFRVQSSLPTLNYLLERDCKVVIISHLGRPEGRDASCSLKVVAKHLGSLLNYPLLFVDDCIGEKVRMSVKKAPKASIVVLENLRYYPQEEKNDSDFAKKLARASGADYFVQDGFGVVHRAHASTAAITQFLPSVSGLLLEKEYQMITNAMKHPEHPFVAVLGGAKVSDKLPLIEALEPVVDAIVIGGAMANTFLAAAGVTMGASKYEKDQAEEIKVIYRRAIKKVGADAVNKFLVLPTDAVVAKSPDEHTKQKNVSINEIAEDEMALDIGSDTAKRFAKIIAGAKTVIWNGTMGFAEKPEFAHGSQEVARTLAKNPRIVSIIGGGDTADFALHWDHKKGGSFGHVSTGGGASLELMAGNKLPGVEYLLDARR